MVPAGLASSRVVILPTLRKFFSRMTLASSWVMPSTVGTSVSFSTFWRATVMVTTLVLSPLRTCSPAPGSVLITLPTAAWSSVSSVTILNTMPSALNAFMASFLDWPITLGTFTFWAPWLTYSVILAPSFTVLGGLGLWLYTCLLYTSRCV